MRNPNKRSAEAAAKTGTTTLAKKWKKTGFGYGGDKIQLSNDPRAYADLFRSLGGSIPPPLSPPEEMEENDGYQKVTQLMVKLIFLVIIIVCISDSLFSPFSLIVSISDRPAVLLITSMNGWTGKRPSRLMKH